MDMQAMMKQMQKMQADMKDIQSELKAEIISTGAGRGAVLVSVNGDMEMKSLTIDPKLAPMDDPQRLAEMIMFATNEALSKSKESAAKKMGKIAGGLNIPGLNGMLGK